MSHKTIALIAILMAGVFFSIVVVYPLIFNPSQVDAGVKTPVELPAPIPAAPPTGPGR